MGSGRWSADTYDVRARARVAAGKDTFAYGHDAIRSGCPRPHQTLDPKGLMLRESRDGDEHPRSNAILISLDVTGSMGRVVRGIHADLPRLHELLLGHRFVSDPQICFAAVGDATCDAVPLQVGQFESDNRMDQHLENMVLEGGGGGQQTESYELLLYVAARHTALDCFEKRGRKGYFFMIGDEMAYPLVKRKEVGHLIGPGLQSDVPLRAILDEVRRKYHFYFVVPGGASNGRDEAILGFWRELIGDDHVIVLDAPEETSECIALTIGANEGAIPASEAAQTLADRSGLWNRTLGRVGRVMSNVLTGAPPAKADRPRRL